MWWLRHGVRKFLSTVLLRDFLSNCTVLQKTFVVPLRGSSAVAVVVCVQLVISRELLPVNPRLILSCCEDERIEGECLQACTIGKVVLSRFLFSAWRRKVTRSGTSIRRQLLPVRCWSAEMRHRLRRPQRLLHSTRSLQQMSSTLFG